MSKEKNITLSSDEEGKKMKVHGYEAIARGAYEAGVAVAAGFPGMPTTDILNSLQQINDEKTEKENGYFVDIEWSTNQKLGFEVAISGSMCNARSLAVMKHIGFNVAADAFMTSCYAGALGGLVFVSIDDPSMHTSENEQDNRYYGLHGLVPIFQPSSVQEVKDMIKYAYDFSEKYETVILFHTTLRLIQDQGEISFGDIQKIDRDYRFTEEYRARWTHLPSNARVNRKKLIQRLEKISDLAEDFPFNQIINEGHKLGVLTSGICYKLTQNSLDQLDANDKISTFKLGMAYPYPRKKLTKFMKGLDKLIVIEELEPIFEEYVKYLAFDEDIPVEIHGKDIFPEAFEFTEDMIQKVLGQFIEGKIPEKLNPQIPALDTGADDEKMQLQEIFYKMAKEVEDENEFRFIYTGDFGSEKFHEETQEIVNTFISQGASIGFANGISKLDDGTVLSFLNNNSFYHSGYYGLINAVYNENDMIMVFVNELADSAQGLENIRSSNASKYLKRQPKTKEEFKDMIFGMGVPEENIFFTEVEENNIKKAFEKAAKASGVRVIISI